MKKEYFYLCIAIIIMSLTTCICNHISIITGMLFVLFEIFCIIIPGTALMMLFQVRNITKIEMVLFTYIGGYIFSIIAYGIIMLLKADKWLNEIYGIFVIVSIVIIVLSFRKINLKDFYLNVCRKEVILLFATILSIFLIKLLTFSISEVFPIFAFQATFNRDFLHWVSDIVSCKMSVPPINIRTLSESYQYHYLGALQLALLSKWMGVSAVTVTAVFSYIQPTIMLALASCCIIFRLVENIHIRILSLLLLFLTNGIENISIVTYWWHIFIQPMTFDIGYAFFMTVILVIIIQLYQKKINYGFLILNILLIGSATGIKGPCGMLATGAMGIACIYWLFSKNYIKGLSYGITTLISFVVVYMGMMPKGAENYSTIIGSIFSIIKSLLEFPKFYIITNPFIMTIAGGFIIYLFVKRKMTIQHWIFSIVLLVGVSMGHFISMAGTSEMYFTMTVMCLAAFLTGQAFDTVIDVAKTRKALVILYGICIVTICISLLTDYDRLLCRYINSDINVMFHAGDNDINKEGGTSNTVSYNEYLAYNWIRENTNMGEVFLSERNLWNPLEENVISALAERKAFYYENDEVKELGYEAYGGNKESLMQLVDKGIGYVIVHKDLSPNFNWPAEMGNMIFENEAVIVYCVLSNQ